MDIIKQEIIKKIEKYQNIAIFFHEVPDFDTLGSSFAFCDFLKAKFPKKNIKIVGLDILDESFGKNIFIFPKDHVENSFLKSAIGVIFDTANNSRVWTIRHTECAELISIDHHPKADSIATKVEWIDPSYSSTCEMVTEFLFDWDEEHISPMIATYLFAGIVTDTGRFRYHNVSSKTFFVASKLIEKKIDIGDIYRNIYSRELEEVKFNAYVFKNVRVYNKYNFAYLIIPKNLFDKFGIKNRSSKVELLSNIKNINIWMSIYYDNSIKRWKGSIRSENLVVNEIVSKYNGGGHKYAAGFILNNLKDHKKLIKDVINYIKIYHDGK